MVEQQKPDWPRGLAAVGLALLVIGAIARFAVVPMVIGGLILLCVGVATSGRGKPDGPAGPTPERDPDRPWRRKSD
ncbi:hypothetical protein [Streptomyces nymphaeiformis]|jgi:hypothetical protein|uniref:Uncharacterized protein n=1 Tax=Streptomyces nymphaeiformis TaxID=2663842 RepID=A0A7W7U7F0_9ACTN|nr:hypothetical protein [Streptomyces nymphaeiformis]MBB4985020.1 hypothetical protein [Streptomyces nymphaeiformis]